MLCSHSSCQGSAGVRLGLKRKEEKKEVYEGCQEKGGDDGEWPPSGVRSRGALLSCAYRSLCPQAEERSQFEILKAQMFAERLAKRNRRTKRARAMPEDEPAAGPGKRPGVHSVSAPWQEELAGMAVANFGGSGMYPYIWSSTGFGILK